jgi:ATP-dependent RNA helicase DDX35
MQWSHTDADLVFYHRIRRKRPALRLIVSSATLDAASFLDYFAANSPDDAVIVSIEGRMYPVEVAYLQEPTPDYVRKAAETVWNINLQVRRLASLDFLVHLFTMTSKDQEMCLSFSLAARKLTGAWRSSPR